MCWIRQRLPILAKIIEAGKRAGEEAFTRKLEYLSEFGRTINAKDVDSQVLSQVMLQVIDEKWKDHLYDLDQLRNAIQYRAYGQKDPLVEYKREAFEMFEDLIKDVQTTFTEQFLKIQVTAEPPRRQPPPPPPTSGRRDRTTSSAHRRPSAVPPRFPLPRRVMVRRAGEPRSDRTFLK